jgi:hypothetical protein
MDIPCAGQMTVSIRRADRPHDKTTTVSLSTIEGREQYANLGEWRHYAVKFNNI